MICISLINFISVTIVHLPIVSGSTMTGVLLDRALKNYYSVTAFGSKELIDNNQIVPVSESEICGDVMVCSYGDLNDVQVFREFGLKEIVAIDQYGKIGEMELR